MVTKKRSRRPSRRRAPRPVAELQLPPAMRTDDSLWDVPEGQRARLATAFIARRVVDLMNALKDASNYGTRDERNFRLASLDIAFAIARAQLPEDLALVRKMQRGAVLLCARHRAATVDEVELPAPSEDYDLPAPYTLKGSKLLLLDIVEAATARVVRPTERLGGGRVDRTQLDRVLKDPTETLKALGGEIRARARHAAAVMAVNLIDCDDRVAPLLGRTLHGGGDVARVGAVLGYLIKRRMATTIEITKTVLYACGAPWTYRHNLFTKKLLKDWSSVSRTRARLITATL